MTITKRARNFATIVGSGIVVASSACAVDSTAPATTPSVTTPERVSSFSPTAANKALVGVADGVYTVMFDPSVDQVFSLGPNRLEIPARAVCKLGTSGYGPEHWNRSCTPETGRIKLVVTIKDANTDKPYVDFQPAMRFNPQTKVSLYFYVPRVSREAARNWTIKYCANAVPGARASCINEALTDPDLQTYIDYRASVLFRRIKHFSGYRVDGGYVVGE